MDGLEPLIADALAPVLRDLRATGGPIPRVVDERWGHAELQATATVQGERTTGGVSVNRGDRPAEQIVSAADGTEEWAVDELWLRGLPTSRPACPQHLETHPLSPELRDEVPVWSCPLTAAVIGRIGSLGAEDQPADTR